MLSVSQAESHAADLVALARKAGADAADALYVGGVSTQVQMRLGALEDVEHSEGEEIGLRAFVAQHGLTPVGIHFWRSKWSAEDAETVSRIYTDVLRIPEPKYTKPPTLDKVRKQIGDIGSKWF